MSPDIMVIYASYHRQFSADSIGKNYEINSSFVSLERSMAPANKTAINFMVFILIFKENCLYYDTIHDFSVLLKTISKLYLKY